jgi:tetratricopeptide (TPR) repeat protein
MLEIKQCKSMNSAKELSMRLYRRSKQWDLKDSITRCYNDADRGYVALAFERLKDIEDELGEDAKIWYARGSLHLDFLGQGLKAYECFVKALALDPSHTFAACNASEFAPNLADCLKWADIAWQLSPEDRPVIDNKKKLLSNKDNIFYGGFQGYLSTIEVGMDKPGNAAAHMEISLQLVDHQEIDLRRARAEILRGLDKVASQQFESRLERFSPQERLALAEAVAEIDRVLALDEYSEKDWNFKSGWCYLLGRYEDSISAADHAIQLSPEGYHRPYLNKSQSLMRLHRIDEARECAQKARQIAEQSASSEITAEIPMIDQILSALDECLNDSKLTSEEIGLLMSRIVRSSQVSADQVIGKMKGTLQDSMAMFRQALTQFPWGNPHATGTALDYVPFMAQALEYAPPEYWWMVIHSAKEGSKTYENCILATLFIAVHAGHIMQRDALLLLFLTILVPATPGRMEQIIESPPPNTAFRVSSLKNKANLADEMRYQQICELYRVLILAVSAAATDEMAQLDHLMQQEFTRILPELSAAIAEQEPVTESDKARAKTTILSQLQGTPFIVDPSTPRVGSQHNMPGKPILLPTPRNIVGQIGLLIRIGAIFLSVAGIVMAFFQHDVWYWLILAGVLAWWLGGMMLTIRYMKDSGRS